MKNVTLSPELAPLIEQMSRDMAVPVEGLVNQAIFNWARLHGYVEPSVVRDESKENTQPPAPPVNHLSDAPLPSLGRPVQPPPRSASPDLPEPVTTPVPVTPPPEDDEHGMGEMTAPSIKRLQRLILVVGDRETLINTERFIIGRDVSCNLTIDAPRISRQHAALVTHERGVTLQDLNSSNGTWFDGNRVAEQELQNGDEFHLGDVLVRIEFR